jgi:hypothetical protein
LLAAKHSQPVDDRVSVTHKNWLAVVIVVAVLVTAWLLFSWVILEPR